MTDADSLFLTFVTLREESTQIFVTARIFHKKSDGESGVVRRHSGDPGHRGLMRESQLSTNDVLKRLAPGAVIILRRT
jgi:hypothetical protein